ncbi:MAG: hypothetical protein U1E22_02975 [Coriobacteriia bacterium]|nr:hypothetical protein [Coriobacteriia bacterium]
MAGDDRRHRLDRAVALIEGDDDRSLLYAALELRQLIELVVYRKLKSYSKWIPAVVTQSWQPAHAFKMLLEFEPDADKDFTLSVSLGEPGPDGPWMPLGQHKSFSARWLTKTYNKLGSYVHIPHGRQTVPAPGQLRQDLRLIAQDIREIVAAPIIAGTLDTRVSIECMVCGQTAVSNVDALREKKKLTCFNPECGAVHIAEEVEGDWRFSLDMVTVECLSCGSGFGFARCLVSPGTTLDCPECGAVHVIAMGMSLRDDSTAS